MRNCPWYLIAILLLVAAMPGDTLSVSGLLSPVTVQPVVIEKIPFSVKVENPRLDNVPFALMIIRGGDEAVYTHNGIIPATVRNIRVPATGDYQVILTTAGATWETNVRSIKGYLALLPPVFAILIALVFRQVYVALFAGIWLGAFIIKDFNPIAGFFYVIDHYAVDTLAGDGGWDHASIAVFTLLLGGLVKDVHLGVGT